MASTTTGSGSPCGACKFLRRRCAPDCVFAPYFCSDSGPGQFSAIHRIFGASNASKLLSHIPVLDRYEAVMTIAYEAQARVKDPVYGCVGHIIALQQQVAFLQAQLMQIKADLLRNAQDTSTNIADSTLSIPLLSACCQIETSRMSPQSTLDSDNHNRGDMRSQDMRSVDDSPFPARVKRRRCTTDWGELQQVAFSMMRKF